jgi:hypothetical protein
MMNMENILEINMMNKETRLDHKSLMMHKIMMKKAIISVPLRKMITMKEATLLDPVRKIMMSKGIYYS